MVILIICIKKKRVGGWRENLPGTKKLTKIFSENVPGTLSTQFLVNHLVPDTFSSLIPLSLSLWVFFNMTI